MKMLYCLRIFFISFEFSLLIACAAIYLLFGDPLGERYSFLIMDRDAVKWLMLYPVGAAGWTLKEGIGVIFPDEKTSRALHEWPEYWKLKAHFNVGVFNSVAFLLPCLAVWLLGSLNTFGGAWAFMSFAIALSINASSFYFAKITLRSILIQLR